MIVLMSVAANGIMILEVSTGNDAAASVHAGGCEAYRLDAGSSLSSIPFTERLVTVAGRRVNIVDRSVLTTNSISSRELTG